MEWISIKDKLPQKYDQEVIVAYYDENYNEFYTGFAYFREGEFYNEAYDIDLDQNVSYWMPLPEYPGKENEIS